MRLRPLRREPGNHGREETVMDGMMQDRLRASNKIVFLEAVNET